MGTELVIRNSDDLQHLLNQEHIQIKVFAGLPRGLTQERMTALAVRALMKEPKLCNCTPVSILDSIAQACNLGLEPDGVLGHCYLSYFEFFLEPSFHSDYPQTQNLASLYSPSLLNCLAPYFYFL